MALTSKLSLPGNAKRVEEIVRVLTKYGLGEWLGEAQPELVARFLKSAQGESIAAMTREQRIRFAITELGTTFIKLGQILSTRPDMIGPELAGELSKLQAGTPADAPEVVRATVEGELGLPLEQAFGSFELDAFASASIGQVHHATLPDGLAVVVKVQHAGIEQNVIRDLDILAVLAELAERYSPELRLYRPQSNVADFRRQLLRELDFGRELRNLEQFNRNFADEPEVRAPRPYRDHSTRRVLTMERIDGTSVAHPDRLREQGVDNHRIAEQGASAYLDMIFRDGFYHADPHPGNIVVETDGETLVFLDFGMIGRVDDLTREKFEGVLMALASRDSEELSYYLLQLGDYPPDLDRQLFARDVAELVAEHIPAELRDLDFSAVVNAANDVVRAHHLILDPGYALILKVLVTLEGTARHLTMDFNLAAFLSESQPRILRSRFGPVRLARKMQRRVRDWDRLSDMAPRDIAEILQRVRAGNLEINLEHRRLDKVVNRLVYGILSAALFLGSVQLWVSEVPPIVAGLPVLGVLGVAAAVALAGRLLYAVRKSGDL